MEFKRIFLNRKTITLMLLLIVICIGLFVKEQADPIKEEKFSIFSVKDMLNQEFNIYKGKNIEKSLSEVESKDAENNLLLLLHNYDELKSTSSEYYYEYCQEDEASLRSEYPQLAELYDNNKEQYTDEYINSRHYIYAKLQTQLEYISCYKDKLSNIFTQAESIKEISVFSDPNSFSQKNINKTVKDYSVLKQISPKFDNYESVASVMSFDTIHYVILIFIIWIVYQFFSERKNGLHEIVFTTKDGRKKLAVKRLSLLFIGIAAFTILMYAVIFITSVYIWGGFTEYTASVQSIPMFFDFTVPMSIIEFLAFFILLKIIFLFAVALIIWLVMSIIHNRHIAFAVLGIIFTVEYVFFHFIIVQSNFAVLKFINIIYLINPVNIIVNYRNMPFFLTILNTRLALIISGVFLVVIFSILNITVNNKIRPIYSPSPIEKFLMKQTKKIRIFFNKRIANLSPINMEIYKILFSQKGIVVIIVLIYVVFSGVKTNNNIYYGSVDSILNEFYKNYGGEPDKSAYDYIANLTSEIEEAEEQFRQARVDYNNGIIDEKEISTAINRYYALDDKRNALKVINQVNEYIEDLKEETGIQAWFVNNYGYNFLLGEDSFQRQNSSSLLSLFCVVLLFSGIISFENKNKTTLLIRSSKYGRNRLFLKKVLAVTTITIFIWAVIYSVELYNACYLYDIDYLSAPVQSLEFLRCIPFKVTIAEFLIQLYILRFLLLLACAMIVYCISSYASYEISLIASIFILLVPSLLNVLGLNVFGYFSISKIIAITENLISPNMIFCFSSIVVLLLFGIVSTILAKRKWCNPR